jgi:hypothetical protein
MERCSTEQPELYQVGSTDVRCLLHEDGSVEEKTS